MTEPVFLSVAASKWFLARGTAQKESGQYYWPSQDEEYCENNTPVNCDPRYIENALEQGWIVALTPLQALRELVRMKYITKFSLEEWDDGLFSCSAWSNDYGLFGSLAKPINNPTDLVEAVLKAITEGLKSNLGQSKHVNLDELRKKAKSDFE